MNERIKQLAKQADPQFTSERNDDMGHALIGTEAIEKFAELIVRECADVAFLEANSRKTQRAVLQHFGVKE